jgi:hypothetical protein
VEFAKNANREDDLVIFDEKSGLSFSYLEYEVTRKGKGAGETINIVDLIMSIYELGKNYQAGNSGGESERFWDSATRRAISRMVDLLKLARQPLTVDGMRQILINAFSENDVIRYINIWKEYGSEETSKKAKKNIMEDYLEWKDENYFLYCFSEANSRDDLTLHEKEVLTTIGDYWFKIYPSLSEKTTAIIVESFLGLVEPFLGGILKANFSNNVSEELRPENCYLKNKIIILDFPTKDFMLAGILAQGAYKFIWQQAMERRRIEEEEDPKTVFLWVDESQNFILPEADSQFQTTARSSRVACVYLTQNINNYYFAMGKNNPQARAKSLLGNLATKIFCANSDYDTNKWASEMIGKSFIDITSTSIGSDKKGSKTFNKQLHYKVPTDHFTILKSGRAENKYKVESIVFMTGKKWSNNENYLRVEFDQRN